MHWKSVERSAGCGGSSRKDVQHWCWQGGVEAKYVKELE